MNVRDASNSRNGNNSKIKFGVLEPVAAGSSFFVTPTSISLLTRISIRSQQRLIQDHARTSWEDVTRIFAKSSYNDPYKIFSQEDLVKRTCARSCRRARSLARISDFSKISRRSSHKDLDKITQGPLKRISSWSLQDLLKMICAVQKSSHKNLYKILPQGPVQDHARTWFHQDLHKILQTTLNSSR